jgi:hypothetical protein
LSEALPLLTELRDRVLAVRGNLAILAGLQAQRQGEREAAEQAYEEALRLFEQSAMPAFTVRVRYVRQLLADLREPPTTSTTGEPASETSAAGTPLVAMEPDVAIPLSVQPIPAEPVAAGNTAPPARRRWWPWGRK